MLSDGNLLCICSLPLRRLNAPYGAPRFLTLVEAIGPLLGQIVLMHLMVLRTFCPSDIYADNIKYLTA